jgi:hypothetical protein
VKKSQIRALLLRLAEERGPDATFCPSDAARRLAKDWRPLMDEVREVAAKLVEEKKLVCTQKGRTVHPLTAKGAIRLGKA